MCFRECILSSFLKDILLAIEFWTDVGVGPVHRLFVFLSGLLRAYSAIFWTPWFFFFFFFFHPHLQHIEGFGDFWFGPLLPIRAIAAGLSHSHSNVGSELHLQPTLQLAAVLDPQPTEWGQDPYGHYVNVLTCWAITGT